MGLPLAVIRAYFGAVLFLQIVSLLPLSVLYTAPCFRPHPRRTLRQNLARKLMYDVMLFYARTRPITPLPPFPGKLRQRTVFLTPCQQNMYRGPLADDQIRPVTVSGTWYPDAPSADIASEVAKTGSLLLHFHGGGYVMGSGLPGDSACMASLLTRHVAPLALFAEYRLSCTPAGRFPAALQDAVSAYTFLIARGVKPEAIILSGDSAGGHLCISLLRYIREHALDRIPEPRCVLLWSPWVDLAGAAFPTPFSSRSTYATDYIPAAFAEWAVSAFAPPRFVDTNGPYVTLVDKPFRTRAKLWVHVGGLEVLRNEVELWVRGMKNAGCEVVLRIDRYATHDIVETAYLNGFKKEADDACKAAALWIDALRT